MARRLDPWVRRLVLAKPNLAVAHYLMHSFLYYEMDSPVIEDDTFDWLVAFLAEHWDEIEHPHKGLLDREFLKSGFHLTYPERVISAARALL